MSVQEILIKKIKKQGAISVSSFMDSALFDPDYGYYNQKEPFGHIGDFITAPEISQVFGELLGIWCADMWIKMGKPNDIMLVEMGPGRGTLMRDLLRGTKHIAGFHEAITVHMIETSPRLTAIQAENLHEYQPKITWHCDLNALPSKPMLFIANELFDAMPIDQYIFKGELWFERKISCLPNDQLVFVEEPCEPPILPFDMPEDGIRESCPLAEQVMQKIAAHITSYSGAGLIIDYGYEEPAYQETLQAVQRHEYHPILTDVGLCDVTAHVNFTALMRAARKAGATCKGPVDQGELLQLLGIRERTSALIKGATHYDQETMVTGAWRLIDPVQMGELFKALCVLPKDSKLQPAGFR